MALFYRVGNPLTEQGLWYDMEGRFTGLIHDKFKFCQAAGLLMPYDPELVGFLSATESLEELYKWFPEAEIKQLQEMGLRVHVYEAENVKFYAPYQHKVIEQKTSRLVETLLL